MKRVVVIIALTLALFTFINAYASSVQGKVQVETEVVSQAAVAN